MQYEYNLYGSIFDWAIKGKRFFGHIHSTSLALLSQHLSVRNSIIGVVLHRELTFSEHVKSHYVVALPLINCASYDSYLVLSYLMLSLLLFFY